MARDFPHEITLSEFLGIKISPEVLTECASAEATFKEQGALLTDEMEKLTIAISKHMSGQPTGLVMLALVAHIVTLLTAGIRRMKVEGFTDEELTKMPLAGSLALARLMVTLTDSVTKVQR